MVWNSREDILNNCVVFVRSFHKDDAEILCTLLLQHIGTSGPGSNIISNHNRSKNGRRWYLELKGRFLTESHE